MPCLIRKASRHAADHTSKTTTCFIYFIGSVVKIVYYTENGNYIKIYQSTQQTYFSRYFWKEKIYHPVLEELSPLGRRETKLLLYMSMFCALESIFMDNDYHVLNFFYQRFQKFTINFFHYRKSVNDHQVVHKVKLFLPVWGISV